MTQVQDIMHKEKMKNGTFKSNSFNKLNIKTHEGL